MIYFICLFVIPTNNLLFSDLFNFIHFLKFNSSINLPFFASSERSRISTRPAYLNHPIQGRLVLTFLLAFLNDSSLSFFFKSGEVLDFLMRMSIPSLPHCIYQFHFFSYTYVFQCIPLQ